MATVNKTQMNAMTYHNQATNIVEVHTGKPLHCASEYRKIATSEAINAIDSVCRIIINNTKGASGFLISEGLIMTNNHVLDSEETCEKSYVEFFYEKDKKAVRFELDPSRFFYTSIREENTSLREGHLDYSIVAIKGHISKLKDIKPINIFENVVPKLYEDLIVIQHPGGRAKEVAHLGSYLINIVSTFEVSYNNSTEGGSSGSLGINDSGKPMTLHVGGVEDKLTKQGLYNYGVPLNAIVKDLTNANISKKIQNYTYVKYNILADIPLVKNIYLAYIRNKQ